MDNEKLIQKFLHGQLTDEETNLLNQKVQDDSEFAEQLEIESAFYAQRNLNLKKELNTPNDTDATHKPKRNFTKPLVLLALLTGLFFISQFVTKKMTPKKTHLAAEYLEVPFEAPPTLMNNETNKLDKSEEWSAAMTEYKNNNFDLAANQISAIKRRTLEQELYLGLSYLYDSKNENLDLSLKSLDNVLGFPNSKFNDIALWYAALNCIEQGMDKRAKEHLDEIINAKSWNHQKAEKLIKLIQSK